MLLISIPQKIWSHQRINEQVGISEHLAELLQLSSPGSLSSPASLASLAMGSTMPPVLAAVISFAVGN